jgi:hypothetical protein
MNHFTTTLASEDYSHPRSRSSRIGSIESNASLGGHRPDPIDLGADPFPRPPRRLAQDVAQLLLQRALAAGRRRLQSGDDLIGKVADDKLRHRTCSSVAIVLMRR